mmetsp:Transcript_17466/g.43566  ORF Transcript_17466/g.43566 Transcript_17466/m.43566 type:complete len:571 (-) Transcript_17466:874-2586(-)
MRRSGHGFPVIKTHLRECLSSGVRAEISGETERFQDRQVCQKSDLRCSWLLVFTEDVTTTTSQNTVDVTHGILRNRNVGQENWFKKTRLSRKHRRKDNTTRSRHDLPHTTMDSIGVENNIHEVETASSQLFFTKRTRSDSPVETGDNGFLDFQQVVDSLGGINVSVRSVLVRSESPDLSGLSDIPAEIISELASQSLAISLRIDLTIFNGVTKLSRHGFGFEENTVVLVGRLSKTGKARLALNGFTVRNNGIRDLDLSSHEIVLEILQTNFQVEFSGCSDNVFTGFTNTANNHRIGLGQTLHTLDQLRKIGRVLGLNGATNDRRHRELHGLNGVGIISGGNSSRLQQVLVNTYQGAGVSSRDVSDLFGVFTHHDNSTLDVLDPEFGLLSCHVVRTHDTDLLSGSNLSREDTTEGVETSLIGSRNHLRNVHAHRGTLGSITGTNGSGSLIIQRTVVKTVNTVSLGLDRGRKVQDNHLQNGVTGRKPLLHDTLQQLLSSVLLFFTLKFDTNGLQHLLDLSVFLSHDSIEEGSDRGSNELAEGTFKGSSLVTGSPNGTLGIEVPVTPKLINHL